MNIDYVVVSAVLFAIGLIALAFFIGRSTGYSTGLESVGITRPVCPQVNVFKNMEHKK